MHEHSTPPVGAGSHVARWSHIGMSLATFAEHFGGPMVLTDESSAVESLGHRPRLRLGLDPRRCLGSRMGRMAL
jgi:hypothetical protein